MKFKNRLGAPESIHMRGFSPKNEQIWPRGLGCRGGATDFGGFSPCISLASVLAKGLLNNDTDPPLIQSDGKSEKTVRMDSDIIGNERR